MIQTVGAGARGPRLYKPFRDVPAKPTRRELIGLLRRIYGPGIPRFMGSPYAGVELNDAEIVLHELAHMTQFDFGGPVPIGAMESTWQSMMNRTKRMTKAVADRYEIGAIAIVILVSRRLRLPLSPDVLLESGARNSATLHGKHKEFEKRVRDAEATPSIRFAADQVLALIDLAWAGQQKSDNRCNGPSGSASLPTESTSPAEARATPRLHPLRAARRPVPMPSCRKPRT